MFLNAYPLFYQQLSSNLPRYHASQSPLFFVFAEYLSSVINSSIDVFTHHWSIPPTHKVV